MAQAVARLSRRAANRIAALPPAARVHACALLCACGVSLFLLAAAGEMTYHAEPPGAGAAQVGAGACLGALLGLWLPRRVIRRRLERGACRSTLVGAAPGDTVDASAQMVGATAAAEPEFAASLVGGLMLATAVCALLAWLAVLGTEAYRGLLVGRFVLPAGLIATFARGPALIAATLATAAATTTLIGLHGWHRLHFRGGGLLRLWSALLTGVLIAGLLTAAGEAGAQGGAASANWIWLGPLLIFVAAALSAMRLPAEVRTRPPDPPIRPIRGTAVLALAPAALAAFATGVALLASWADEWPSAGAIGRRTATLAGGALLGAALADALLRQARLGGAAGPSAVLAAAMALLIPFEQIAAHETAALLRAGTVAAACSACAFLLGRRLARSCGSAQHALVRVGAAVTIGLLAALGGLPLLFASPQTGLTALITSLGLAATAGLVLVFDRAAARLRLAGLTAVTIWLGATPLVYSLPAHATAQASNVGVRTGAGAPAAGRALLDSPGLRTARLTLDPGDAAASAWRADLARENADLIIVRCPDKAGETIRSIADARRLVHRLANALAAGGRLAFELPAPEPLDRYLASCNPSQFGPDCRGFRVHVCGPAGTYDAILLGRDIPAWLAQQPRPAGLEVRLFPLPTPPQHACPRDGANGVR